MTDPSGFLCLVSHDRQGLSQQEVDAGRVRIGRSPVTIVRPTSHAMVMVRADMSSQQPTLFHQGALAAVGYARLDNRVDIVRWLGTRRAAVGYGQSDVALAALTLTEGGPDAVGRLIGDFGIILYDGNHHITYAACDPFGVESVFFATREQTLWLSSRAGWLADGEYDERYCAHFLAAHKTTGPWTMFADVTRVTHGEYSEWRGPRRRSTRYWDPAKHIDRPLSPGDARDAFRHLFRSAVSQRTASDGPVWAELSGGVDSSSVVVTAHDLGRSGVGRPLDGTITVVDSFGTGNELSYVDAVIAQTGLRNERIWDDWPWRDDGELPPLPDEPFAHFPFFARDRRMAAVIRCAGARVLLSGQGADHYLSGNYNYITDQLAALHVKRALGDAKELAIAQSWGFWRILWSFGVLPFLSSGIRYPLVKRKFHLPDWLDPGLVARHGMRELVMHGMPLGDGHYSRFLAEIFREIDALPNSLRRGTYPDGVDVRYPFLHRPLVELAIGLAPELITRGGYTKIVLREAMRETLPEIVRQRRSKGGLDSRVAWSLGRERKRLARLLNNPILAEMGLIRPDRLRTAVERARCGDMPCTAFLISTLALETWLAVRAGLWEVQPSVPDSAATMQSYVSASN
jgi:asparagine synthase (glutamine-hydrolysing)